MSRTTRLNLTETLASSMLPTDLLIGLIYVVMGLLLVLPHHQTASRRSDLQPAGLLTSWRMYSGWCCHSPL